MDEKSRGSAESNDPPSSASELLEKLSKGERPSYTKKGEIARGGMGAILRIRDEVLRRDLAMKVVLEERGGGDVESSSAYVHRFLEEAQVTAQLDHPGVVPVHELGVDENGQMFFTMKLVQGRTLGEIFKLVKEEEEDWNRTRALQLFVRVCETLAFAHSKGVIHRDLKPANIMVGDFGEVYVMDWGLAKVLGEHAEPAEQRDDQRSLVLSERAIEARASDAPDSPQMTQAGDILGTPAYMPVEQAFGQDLDARSDVYAIGAMLYELLTGHTPYGEPEKKRNVRDVLVALMAEPPAGIQERAPKLPAEIIAITEKAMARDPANRYQTAAELGEDLRHFIEGRVVRAYRTGPLVELKKWVGRNRALASALGAAIVLLVVGFLATSSLYVEARDERRTAERREIEKGEALQHARVLESTYAASASAAAVSVDPMLALLLARAAARTRMLPEVNGQLQIAIRQSRERAEFRGHTGALRSVACSPSGSHVLTASDDKTARLWDLKGKLIRSFKHQGSVWSVAFSPSGDHVLTASWDRTARVWDLDGTLRAPQLSHDDRVYSAVFSPKGDRILTASGETAYLWDLEGNEIARFEGHTKTLYSAVLSPKGDRVLTASKDETARLWDLDENELRQFPHADQVSSAVFSPNGDHVLTASWDGTARVWDLDGNVDVVLEGHTGRVSSATFSPAGDRILTCSTDRTARLWDRAGNEIAVLRGHMLQVFSAVFTHVGEHVLTASNDKTARLWELRERELSVIQAHERSVLSAVFSPAGDRILTASADGTARIFDLEGNERVLFRGHAKRVFSAVFSPSGDHVLTGGEEGSVRLWSQQGDMIKELAKLAGPVHSANFSPSGDRVVTASRMARVWDLEGKEVQSFPLHRSNNTFTAVFAAAEDRILTGDQDNTARLWDLRGNLIRPFKGHTNFVYSAVFSPAADQILTASADRTVRLWDLEGKQSKVVARHEDRVFSAVFSPAGDRIVTTSWDNTARLWDLEGNELATLRGPDVNSAVFSPSGDRILTASGDGSVRIWMTRPEDVLALANERVTRDFTPEERRRYASLLDDASKDR